MTEDYMLTALARLTETNISIRLVLNVGGLIISGETVSETAYFEKTLAALEQSLRQGANVSETELQKLRDAKDALLGGIRSDPERKLDFVHLANATVLGGPVQLNSGPKSHLWRIRTDSVHGFTLGVIPKDTTGAQ